MVTDPLKLRHVSTLRHYCKDHAIDSLQKFMGHELTGKTVGILGLGHIGQLLVKRLTGFEVKVLGFDPMISPALAEKLGVELCSVERIFAESDFVSLHIPENDSTGHFSFLSCDDRYIRNSYRLYCQGQIRGAGRIR